MSAPVKRPERRVAERRVFTPKKPNELRDCDVPGYVAPCMVFRPNPAPWTGYEWQTDRRVAERRKGE
jgi:hypothetical protein